MRAAEGNPPQAENENTALPGPKRKTALPGLGGRGNMAPNIFSYILKYSKRQQIILTLMAIVSFPFLYTFYELPKQIVNNAIQGDPASFPIDILGFQLDQVTYLAVLCIAFVVLVIINQSFKYVINVYRGITGERMLRRLRYDLLSRMLRFPLPTFRKISQGEIVTMVTAEVEPLGGFVGTAISLPVFQGGTLLVILGFLLVQNWAMALAAVSLYPIQIYLIPRLQKKVNALGKERVKMVRRLSEKVGETVQGIEEVHAHDTSQFELAKISERLGAIYHVRYRIYLLKFIVKFLNNFIQQLGPFFFYSIGGYLVIKGQLEVGTLMAAIAAHKDLAAPWKELLAYYQMQADARIKYEQVVSQFQPAGLMDEELQTTEPDPLPHLQGEVNVANLLLTDDQGEALVDGASFSAEADKRIAVLGGAGSGKGELAALLARLIVPERGSISIGGIDILKAPEAITGRRMAYVGPNSYIFNTSIGDNLFYGLKHRPVKRRQYEGEEQKRYERDVFEAKASGNTPYSIHDDWIDRTPFDGRDDEATLRQAALDALNIVGLEEDVYQFGLRGTIDPDKRPDLAKAILIARKKLSEKLRDLSLEPLIERFDPDRYNNNATLAENMLFGTPRGDAILPERIAENPYVLSVLDKVGLTEELLVAGYQTAATMVELFADLPPDHEFFQQFSFISADDLPEYQALLSKISKDNLDELKDSERLMLLSLPFKLIPARHRLGVLNDELKQKVLQARRVFARDLPEDLRGAIEFFDPERYNAAANLMDNILFGKIAYGQAQAQEKVGEVVHEVIEQAGLYGAIADVGLDFQVGIAGSRLNPAQRQKLAIARAVLKKPDILILSEASAVLDLQSQARIMERILDRFRGRGVFWAVHRAKDAQFFDLSLVMKGGKVVATGPFSELKEKDPVVGELLAAE